MEQQDSARRFTLALAGRAKNVAPHLAASGALDGARLLVDVGGGTGIYSIACLQRYPALRAIVWDRPEVLKVAAEMAAEYGVADRLECRPGDMFTDPVPTRGRRAAGLEHAARLGRAGQPRDCRPPGSGARQRRPVAGSRRVSQRRARRPAADRELFGRLVFVDRGACLQRGRIPLLARSGRFATPSRACRRSSTAASCRRCGHDGRPELPQPTANLPPTVNVARRLSAMAELQPDVVAVAAPRGKNPVGPARLRSAYVSPVGRPTAIASPADWCGWASRLARGWPCSCDRESTSSRSCSDCSRPAPWRF